MSALLPPKADRSGLGVVIAEDEMIIARDLQRMLESMGHRVVGAAPTADGALALVEEHEPDLVLIDIVLKGERSGIWLAQAIRADHRIPVVFTTSHADRGTVEMARETRPNGYLVKPYTRDDVYATVEVAVANYADEHSAIDLAAMADRAGQAGPLAPAALRRVRDHVAKHFDAPLTLGDLAAVAGLSPYHFAHVFKQTVGVPPYQYVVQQRVEEAQRLLRYTDWSVANVGAAVGYESAGHFSTLFKRETGVTPVQFRSLQ